MGGELLRLCLVDQVNVDSISSTSSIDKAPAPELLEH